MKAIIQKNVFNYLLKNDVKNFIGVPDSTMKHFINEGFKKNKILITTREEEAIGVAAGMSMSRSDSLVFMQNAGFANSLSTITSLVQLYTALTFEGPKLIYKILNELVNLLKTDGYKNIKEAIGKDT